MPGRDVTKGYIRERQMMPAKCAKKSFRTIQRRDLKLVVCCPKGKFSRGACRVGMRVQSILRPRRRRKERRT